MALKLGRVYASVASRQEAQRKVLSEGDASLVPFCAATRRVWHDHSTFIAIIRLLPSLPTYHADVEKNERAKSRVLLTQEQARHEERSLLWPSAASSRLARSTVLYSYIRVSYGICANNSPLESYLRLTSSPLHHSWGFQMPVSL